MRPVDYDPEVKARHARPPAWVPPGPAPAGPQGRPELAPGPGEDLSYLTGDWRIFQLKDGHRWGRVRGCLCVAACVAACARPPARPPATACLVNPAAHTPPGPALPAGGR